MPNPTEYRVTFTYACLSRQAEQDAEYILGTWEKAHPQFGPALSVDLNHGTADITIALEGLTPEHALASAQAYRLDADESDDFPVVAFSVLPTRYDD